MHVATASLLMRGMSPMQSTPHPSQLERKDRTRHSLDREQNRRPCRSSLTSIQEKWAFLSNL